MVQNWCKKSAEEIRKRDSRNVASTENPYFIRLFTTALEGEIRRDATADGACGVLCVGSSETPDLAIKFTNLLIWDKIH